MKFSPDNKNLEFSLGNMLFLNSLSGGCPFLCPRVAVWRKRPSIALPRKITTFQPFLLITEDDEGNKNDNPTQSLLILIN